MPGERQKRRFKLGQNCTFDRQRQLFHIPHIRHQNGPWEMDFVLVIGQGEKDKVEGKAPETNKKKKTKRKRRVKTNP